MVEKTIETNIRYQLIEHDAPNRVSYKTIEVVICRAFNEDKPKLQLTPFGALELAKQLALWASSQDSDIKSITCSSLNFWNNHIQRLGK
jgi:hypothetical protein